MCCSKLIWTNLNVNPNPRSRQHCWCRVNSHLLSVFPRCFGRDVEPWVECEAEYLFPQLQQKERHSKESETSRTTDVSPSNGFQAKWQDHRQFGVSGFQCAINLTNLPAKRTLRWNIICNLRSFLFQPGVTSGNNDRTGRLGFLARDAFPRFHSETEVPSAEIFWLWRTQRTQHKTAKPWRANIGLNDPNFTQDTFRRSPGFLFPDVSFSCFQGESNKKITLQTKPDSVLEGEERFTLSLVSADNNADISITDGDAVVVILADEGAAGVVSVATNSTYFVMGEPTADYNGQAQVRIWILVQELVYH